MASMSRDRSSSSTSSSDLGRPELLSRGGRDAGMSYLSPTNAPLPVLTESYRTSPDKYKKSSHRSRSDRRRNDGSGTRELVQMLLSEERDAKDALRALNKTADRLAEETRRADEAERKLVQSHERFKMVNQARQTALQDVSRLQEELRLYKLQLENAQTQITRANEMIAQSDKERHAAEEAAEKARDTARKYHEERLVRDAREEGRKLGRDEGKEEGIKIGYNQALENAYKRARRDAFARLDEYLESQGMELPNVLAEEDEGDDAPEAPGLGFRGAGSIRAASDIADDVLSELDLQNPPRPIQMPVPVTDRRTNIVPPIRPSSSASQPTHRRVISRFLGRRRGNGIDPNVEINRDAPDLAPIVESGPILPVATPLPASATAQPARTSTVSPGPVRMPEPDFNPDPSTVQPIPVRNRSPSIRHSAYDIPPDGFIPTATPDGRIGVPPPHELSRQPSLSGSLADFGGPPIPPKSPIARDFAAEEAERRARSRSPGPSMRGGGGVTPVYQAANITGAYDFDGRSTPGRARTPVHDNGLHRSGSYSSMHSRPRSPVGPRNPEYADPPMAMPEASPMFSPRSGRSFTPGPGPPGPRRPAHLTMPTPLAEQSTGPQVYTRPRINSTGSDMPSDRFSMRSPGFSSGGGIGLGGGGGGGDPRRPPMHRRGTSVTSSGVPDITIEPPSRPPSNTTTKTPGTLYNNYSPGGSSDEDLSGNGFVPPMPQPQIIPPPGAVSPGPPIPGGMGMGMGMGVVGGSPRVAQSELPPGFIPTSPGMPPNMPVPNVLSSSDGGLPIRAPSPRVGVSGFGAPASGSDGEELPPGFVPTSPNPNVNTSSAPFVGMPVPVVDGRTITEEVPLSVTMPVPTVGGRAIPSSSGPGEGNNEPTFAMPVPTVGGVPFPMGNTDQPVTMPVPAVGGVPLPTMSSPSVSMPTPGVRSRPISGEGPGMGMPVPTVGGFPLGGGRGPSEDGRRTATPRDPQPGSSGSNRWSGGSYARASPGMGFGGFGSVNILQQTPSSSAMPLGVLPPRSPRAQVPIIPQRVHELRSSGSVSASDSPSSNQPFDPVIPSRPVSRGPGGPMFSSWQGYPDTHISPVPSTGPIPSAVMPQPQVGNSFDIMDALPVLPGGGGFLGTDPPRSPRISMPSPRLGHAAFPSGDTPRTRSPRPQLGGSTPYAGMGNPLPSMSDASRPRSPMPSGPLPPLSRPGQDSIFGPGVVYDNYPPVIPNPSDEPRVIPDDISGRRTPRAGDYGHRRRDSEASMNTFTTSPGRQNQTGLPVYPIPVSPAFTTMTTGSAVRRVPLPNSRSNTPGALNSYVVTPLHNLSAGMSEDFNIPPPLHSDQNIVIPPSPSQLERPIHGFTNRAAPSPVRRSESRISVSSAGSQHRRYDRSQDLDPAFLIERTDNDGENQNRSPERAGSRTSNRSGGSNQSAGALWAGW